jgi:hypothetical protein
MAIDRTTSITPVLDTGTQYTSPTLRQTITTSSNWTVPSGITQAFVVVAGGGGGGGATSTTSGGGGSGGTVWMGQIPLTPGDTFAVTIGAGGIGTINNNAFNYGESGIQGSATTFAGSSIVIAAAGGAGAGASTQPYTSNGGFCYASASGGTRLAFTTDTTIEQQRQFIINNIIAVDGFSTTGSLTLSTGGFARYTGYQGGSGGGSGSAGSIGLTGGGGANGNSGQTGFTGGSSYFGYTGGAGGATTPVLSGTSSVINAGPGGGGAGIAGNGTAAFRATGPTVYYGGTGGLGGGGGGAAVWGFGSTSGALRGGTGGPGAVLIYY